MTQPDFIAVTARDTLKRHQLDSFDALWEAQGEWVDEPNRARGGFSSVTRLTLDDANGQPRIFYLKRQSNYLIRHMRRPLGEPTVSRELYNIERFARLGIPALEAAFYAEKREGGERKAILLTPDLDGYQPLDQWYAHWEQHSYHLKQHLLLAAARLVALLHSHAIVHNCLYPKHIFLRQVEDGVRVRLIDLEKSRAHMFSPWGRMRDLDALHRRSTPPSRTQRLRFMLHYLNKPRVDAEVRYWVTRVLRRSATKVAQQRRRKG